MNKPSYRRALKDARRELKKLFQQREELEREIARTRQTVIALGRLCDEPSIHEQLKEASESQIGLTEAIRRVVMVSKRPLEPTQIRAALESVGYDPGSSPNVLVSIHTIARRLFQSGEFRQVGERYASGKNKGLFKGPVCFWYGQWGLPKGWADYPTKQLQKEWTLFSAQLEARREIQKRVEEEDLKKKE